PSRARPLSHASPYMPAANAEKPRPARGSSPLPPIANPHVPWPAIRMYQPLAPPGSNVTPARTKRRGCRMKTTRARMTAHRSAKVEENAISRSSTIRLTLGRSPRSSSAQADAEQQETGARDGERDRAACVPGRRLPLDVAVYADEGDAVRVRGIVMDSLDRTLRMPLDPLLERGQRYLWPSEIDLPTNDVHRVARLRLHDIGDLAHVVVERAFDRVQRPRAAVPAVVPGVDVAVRKLRGDRRPPGRLNVLA